MNFKAFHIYFPEIKESEYLELVLKDTENEKPVDKVTLVELFCDTPHCDCRKVMFHVFSYKKNEVIGVINYGWEDKSFYEKWFGNNDEKIIRELKGPELDLWSPQSKDAEDILEVVKEILKKEEYVERIKRHYKLFKESVDRKTKIQDKYVKNLAVKENQIGRNDLCACGSGKKYKKCCEK